MSIAQGAGTQAGVAGAAGTLTAKEKYYFLLRRLHSLTGLVPVGVFVIFHLTVNSTILAGGGSFQFCVDQIHNLEKAGLLIPVEMLTIFIPLAFHAGLGVVIVLGSTPNAKVYRYGGNVRYTLQRATGLIALVFILFHVWQMHWLGEALSGAKFRPHEAAVSAADAMQSWGVWVWVYATGVIATVFHLANGVWTALITWGITIGPRSQRIAGYFCTALGIIVGVIGLAAAYGFQTYSVPPTDSAHTASAVEAPGQGH